MFKTEQKTQVTASGAHIYLHSQDYQKAVALGIAMEKSIGVDDPAAGNPNKFAVPHRFVLGMLGEFAFAQFLTNYGIKYEWNPQANGKSDKGDFVLYVKGARLVIDVKTIAHYRTSVMLAEREYYKNPRWRYVVARQAGGDGSNHFEIHGIANVKDFTEAIMRDNRIVWECALPKLKSPAYITSHCDLVD